MSWTDMKQKAREIKVIPMPGVQNYQEVESIQKPYNTKTSQCSNASTNSLYFSMSKAIEEIWHPNKHKVTVKFSLPSSREMNRDMLQRTKHSSNRRWIDNWCENNINICRYKISPHEEANIHLEIIKEVSETIEQYYTTNNKSKLCIN